MNGRKQAQVSDDRIRSLVQDGPEAYYAYARRLRIEDREAWRCFIERTKYLHSHGLLVRQETQLEPSPNTKDVSIYASNGNSLSTVVRVHEEITAFGDLAIARRTSKEISQGNVVHEQILTRIPHDAYGRFITSPDAAIKANGCCGRTISKETARICHVGNEVLCPDHAFGMPGEYLCWDHLGWVYRELNKLIGYDPNAIR